MELVIDQIKLYEMLKEFHKMTGLKVSFIENYDMPILGVPDKSCELCAYKQRDRGFYLKCRECDDQANRIAAQSNDVYIYECHYHLVEALQPVNMYGRHIGYFLLGQMLTDREKFIRLNNPTPYELSLLDQLASPTLDMLHSASKILAWLAEYTVLNKDIDLIAKQNFASLERYIGAHYSERISVDDLCDAFHYSRPTLFARFKSECNMGPIAYINKLRLEKSKELLSEYDVSETAKRVGFEDANYFSRIFKKNTGVSPSEYAKRIKSQ